MTPRQYNELLRQAEVIERNKPHMEKMKEKFGSPNPSSYIDGMEIKVMNNKANKVNDELIGIAIGTLSMVVITFLCYMVQIIFG